MEATPSRGLSEDISEQKGSQPRSVLGEVFVARGGNSRKQSPRVEQARRLEQNCTGSAVRGEGHRGL